MRYGTYAIHRDVLGQPGKALVQNWEQGGVMIRQGEINNYAGYR